MLFLHRADLNVCRLVTTSLSLIYRPRRAVAETKPTNERERDRDEHAVEQPLVVACQPVRERGDDIKCDHSLAETVNRIVSPFAV